MKFIVQQLILPRPTFEAILFNSPPTVKVSPVYGTKFSPVASGTSGFEITKDSLNHAFKIVTHAPATVACPAP